MSDTVVIIYQGEPVSVLREVTDFLEQDRKRKGHRISGTKGI